MKKNHKTISSLLIFCTILLPTQILASEVYKIFLPYRFDMYLSTEYFKTVSNFGPSGEKKSLLANSSLQQINLQTTARYVFFNDMGFFSGLNFTNVDSNNAATTRTNSQLTHFFLGSDYQFFQSENWIIYADISYFLANEKIDVNQDAALASDGASELKTLLVGIVKSESLRGFAKVGFDYRTSGLSSLLLYGLGGEFLIDASALGVEFTGSSSVKDDQNTNTPAIRDALADRVNAGSRKYYSINPNLLNGEFYYSYAFDSNLVFKINAGASVIGSNSADGYYAGVAVNWGFGGLGKYERQTKQPKKVMNKSSLPDSEPAFIIDTSDGVNQDLFKRVEPQKPKK